MIKKKKNDDGIGIFRLLAALWTNYKLENAYKHIQFFKSKLSAQLIVKYNYILLERYARNNCIFV